MRRAAVVLGFLCLSAGCGNWVGDLGPGAGITGISITESGSLVINAYVCRDYIDTIEVVRDRHGLKETEPNPVVAVYKSPRHLTGSISLNLDNPTTRWSPDAPLRFEPGKGYLVYAQGSGEDANETRDLYLSTRTLTELKPGLIYTIEGGTTKLTGSTPAEFKTLAKHICQTET
ncbi:MAG: hypothetical protein JWQ74_3605 [Marmoricola sp.]|nr:hypothetical protein [Marmoricola sp.]